MAEEKRGMNAFARDKPPCFCEVFKLFPCVARALIIKMGNFDSSTTFHFCVQFLSYISAKTVKENTPITYVVILIPINGIFPTIAPTINAITLTTNQFPR